MAKRKPKLLDTQVHLFCEKDNAAYARKEGAALFGSHSAYINALISRDRGLVPKLGVWKSKGESRRLIKESRKKSKPKRRPRAKKVSEKKFIQDTNEAVEKFMDELTNDTLAQDYASLEDRIQDDKVPMLPDVIFNHHEPDEIDDLADENERKYQEHIATEDAFKCDHSGDTHSDGSFDEGIE